MLFKNAHLVIGFDDYLQEKHKLVDATRYYYVKSLEFFLLDDPNLEDINDYNKFLIKHSIKKRNISLFYVFRAFIKYYIKDANTRNSMLESMIKPEVPNTIKRERRYLNEKEIVAVINNIKQIKHKIIALIQDMTGARAGDVIRIPHGDIVPEIYEHKNVLKIIITGKGSKRNVVYIHDEIVQKLIMDYIVKNVNFTGYYFMEQRQRSRDKSYKERKLYKANHMAYYRDLKQALDKTGIDVKDFATHDYRRCYARRVWNRYKDVQVLQELLNHQDPSTTMRYLKQSGLKNIEYHKQMQS